jgi:hypothetical protein
LTFIGILEGFSRAKKNIALKLKKIIELEEIALITNTLPTVQRKNC